MDYQGTLTYQLLQGTVLGFEAIKRGLVEGGVAYFIALPSMHVSVATFLQVLLRPYRFLFWIFLPINILIIISTVILGYHYFLDVPAGIIVAMLSLIPREWIMFRRAQHQGSFKIPERSLSPISADR
jgi:membrane-associated phospholipid phosphatase